MEHDQDQGGPRDTEFLDLEISRVIHEEGRQLARDAARQLIAEAIRDRLRERLGDKLRAVGELVANELADDVEANLGIEARIEERKASRRDLEGKVRAIMGASVPKAAAPRKR